ncbi:MAG: GNAT family N-acetyltransferase, partial [Ktedonobacterales bacterium]
MAGAHAAPGEDTTMVTLRPMTEPEYTDFIATSLPAYAADRARSEDVPLEVAQTSANEQIAQLLPQGYATPEHHFWRAVAEDGAVVGALWVHHDVNQRRAFIYDIVIEEAQRGKGYGEATMRALEEALRPLRVTHIGLSVFGFNTTARALYDKLGYGVAATFMLKRIGEGA